jgi:hypothetical protein
LFGKKDEDSRAAIARDVKDEATTQLAEANYMFIPIVHSPENFHHTLLVFNFERKEWTHYNSMRPRKEDLQDIYYTKATNLVSTILFPKKNSFNFKSK